MTTLNDFTNRELQQMDIKELRVLARQIGVNSPTTKKKELLICEIINIITGKTIPEVKNPNRGRPAKHFGNYDIQYNTKPFISAFEGSFNFSANKGLFVASPTEEYVINRKNTQLNGVVTNKDGEMSVKKFKFADTLDDAKLSDDIIKKYKLKENDVVCYTKYKDKIEILKVNGKELCDDSELLIGDKCIKLGKRNIVFVDSISSKKQIVDSLAQVGQVVFLPSNNILMFSNKNVILMNNNFSNDQETINNFYASVDIAIFYKKSGINVSLVADNLLGIITAIKQFEYNESVELEKQFFYNIQKLIENSITFVGVIPSTLKSVFTNLDTSFDNIC